MDEFVGTSVEEGDDPSWEQAIRGNDSQKWYRAADDEHDNLVRFQVFEPWAADCVLCDEDIFDCMLVCKRKRGKDNEVIKHKIRCVLCGNQMVSSAKLGNSKTCTDLRTHSPACRGSSLKCAFAVGVLHDMRRQDFDVDAAYLQGVYTDRRVFARAPKYYRRYDERGVELVWLLRRALYGGPDAGRLWYNTFAHYLMHEEQETPFQRCHYEPSAFTHFVSPRPVVDEPGRVVYADPSAVPERILCLIYVDDGQVWDNVAETCDGFLERLQERFSITRNGGGMSFMIGMDISAGAGWVKLCSSTYIRGMCERWLDYPAHEYDRLSTPSHPKLLEYYEHALMTRGNTPPELMHRYRSLVGGLLFPAPMTRPDFLFTAGILARAMDFGTEELFQCALYGLVFLGQTHEDGITYSRHAPEADQLVWWSDSDWAVVRSTTGGTGQLLLVGRSMPSAVSRIARPLLARMPR